MAESFRVQAPDGANVGMGPRAGTLVTIHGDVRTPAFMPVATQASVKALGPDDLRGLGCEVFISNTYHLSLRPGVETIERLGGLHGFTAWDGPIATDSGGFQVASLAHRARISDEALTFSSHLDGTPLHLSPESAIQLQERLGADILMCLDQPLNFGATLEETAEATERTHQWAERSVRAHRGPGLLYGIVQGGTDRGLRQESARTIGRLDCEGIAIGGLSLGEPKTLMWEMVDAVVQLLPPGRPRHLLGVGSPEDLVEGMARGIDSFDCALPTRVARNGGLYTPEGRVDVTGARYRDRGAPIYDGCDCHTCQVFSAAYLHHLFKARELLAYRLASVHNLRFVIRLMEEARAAIESGTFGQFRSDFLARYQVSDEVTRDDQRKRWFENQRTKGSRSAPTDWD
ncbi:MAG: tRNA guanosine(34) transglycosylase Tgt [Chloroflexi bacterium]|nr:tRNA guanosine(34) transglycosylase Tgt [Chloroflexota bacterium]